MNSGKQKSIQFILSIVFTALVSCGLYAQNVQNIPSWGTVTDLDNDCTFKVEEGKVTVTVPGTPHDLSVYYKKKNAPRILQEIEGDFTVQVKVSSDFDPGDKAAIFGKNAFNGAGLLVWDTDMHYLRLERDVWVTPQGKRVSYSPLFEYWKDDKNLNPRGSTLAPLYNGRSTYLRMIRRGDEFSITVSHNGTDWLATNSVMTDLPKKIKIGVSAINTSEKPFTVEFDEFKVETK